MFSDTYTLGPEIGNGGSGIVYKAVRNVDGTEFVVKVSHRKDTSDFLHEYNILSELKNDCIVRVENYFQEGENMYIVMEYISGYDMSVFIDSNKNLPREEYVTLCLKYMKQVYQCVLDLHSAGIAHRDIKLENIMLKNAQTKLIDFGSAVKKDEKYNDFGIGTFDYMSPPAITGKINFNAFIFHDYWCIAVALFILLHNDNPPFSGDTATDFYRNISMGEVDQELFENTDVDNKLKNIFTERYSYKDPAGNKVKKILDEIFT